VLILLRDADSDTEAAYHRPSGRLFARQTNELGTTSFAWVLASGTGEST
jgi:hypothetical protein